MTKLQPDATLIHQYTHQLLALIQAQSFVGPRTYGFEYEFLPEKPLTPQGVSRIIDFLPQCGFVREKDRFINAAGMGVAFEPGGQIEYYSPPLLADDMDRVDQSLQAIEQTNRRIEEALGVVYLATDYIPGRGAAPLCLESERYRLLHERLSGSGTRGHEMMKGTAGIHLHVVMRHISELVPMFAALCEISREPLFKMSAQRRDIWDNTDPCRCGVLYIVIDMALEPHNVVEELVRVGMAAIVLGDNQPFWKVADNNFDRFLYHLTTIFTDVRLNIKGPTLELRTPDSRPVNEFKSLWQAFIDTISATDLK
jgi:gamma-glutamylcysteine synthetase